jgi:hypothetical protein
LNERRKISEWRVARLFWGELLYLLLLGGEGAKVKKETTD